jgi:hypothetical protein
MRAQRADTRGSRPLKRDVRTRMRTSWPTIFICATTFTAFLVSCWGTRILLQQRDLPSLQRFPQMLLVWLLPFIGALLVSELHRPSKRLRRAGTLTADEISPILNQALHPMADGATRAAAGFIENEVVDAVVSEVTHLGDGGAH